MYANVCFLFGGGETAYKNVFDSNHLKMLEICNRNIIGW